MDMKEAIALIQKNHPTYEGQKIRTVILCLMSYQDIYSTHIPTFLRFDSEECPIKESYQLLTQYPSLMSLCQLPGFNALDDNITSAMNTILSEKKLAPLPNTDAYDLGGPRP